MQKAIRRMLLKNMPFDKFDDSNGFIHATGYEIMTEDGQWQVEYEDDLFEDAENCIYENEEDYEDFVEF